MTNPGTCLGVMKEQRLLTLIDKIKDIKERDKHQIIYTTHKIQYCRLFMRFENNSTKSSTRLL